MQDVVPSSRPEPPVPDPPQSMQEIVPSLPPQPTVPDPPQPMQEVEPSPPPRGMLNDEDGPPATLNVRETSYLSLTANRTFYNRRFNVSGFVFFVGIHTRPSIEDREAAFTQVLQELARALATDFLPDDYVQLVFKSGDLDNDFVLPLVKVRNFDRRVAEEQFASILTSNTEVDVGRGDFRIAVYHTRVPSGGGRFATEYGKTVEQFLRDKRCICRIPSQFDPHCLVIALKMASMFSKREKIKNFLRTDVRRNIYSKIAFS